MTTARIVLTTAVNRGQAERLAHTLVVERLAACVNFVAGVHSIYRWQGAVEAAEEVLLIVKTQQDRIAALRKRLHEMHEQEGSYELPEFLVLAPEGGSDAYLAWIAASVG